MHHGLDRWRDGDDITAKHNDVPTPSGSDSRRPRLPSEAKEPTAAVSPSANTAPMMPQRHRWVNLDSPVPEREPPVPGTDHRRQTDYTRPRFRAPPATNSPGIAVLPQSSQEGGAQEHADYPDSLRPRGILLRTAWG